MIYNVWPLWFRALASHDGEWPRAYCAVDCETTGFQVGTDLVTEWGHVLVEDNKVVDRLEMVINWTQREVPPDWWVERQLVRVASSMNYNGVPCHMNYARMQAEGRPPEEAFAFIQEFTGLIKAKGIPFVLHNGFFDEKMLSGNYLQFKFGDGFSFGEQYFDTEGIAKGSLIPDNVRVQPTRNDSLRDYFTRVKYTRVNGMGSTKLGDCVKRFKIDESYGIKPEMMHGAAMDAFCTHLLMQEYGKTVTEPVLPAIWPTADSKATAQAKPILMPAQPVQRVRRQSRSWQ